MKKRKLLKLLLSSQQYELTIMHQIILEMVRAGGNDGCDGDSGSVPDVSIKAKMHDVIQPEPPIYHQ